METALYYTFSTIAQTLAAAIALLAAFLLYRLQSLNSAVEHCMLMIVQHYGGPDRMQLDELSAQGKHPEFLAYHKANPAPSGDIHTLTPRQRLETLLAHRDSVFRAFYLSLWLTVGLLAASVAVLVFTPALRSNAKCAEIIFAIGGIWFLGCLGSYAFLVKKTLS